jgi:hypothetical protein
MSNNNEIIKKILKDTEGLFLSLSKEKDTFSIVHKLEKLNIGFEYFKKSDNISFDIDMDFFLKKIAITFNEILHDGDSYPVNTLLLLIAFDKTDLIDKSLFNKDNFINLLSNINFNNSDFSHNIYKIKQFYFEVLSKNRAVSKKHTIFNKFLTVSAYTDFEQNTSDTIDDLDNPFMMSNEYMVHSNNNNVVLYKLLQKIDDTKIKNILLKLIHKKSLDNEETLEVTTFFDDLDYAKLFDDLDISNSHIRQVLINSGVAINSNIFSSGILVNLTDGISAEFFNQSLKLSDEDFNVFITSLIANKFDNLNNIFSFENKEFYERFIKLLSKKGNNYVQFANKRDRRYISYKYLLSELSEKNSFIKNIYIDNIINEIKDFDLQNNSIYTFNDLVNKFYDIIASNNDKKDFSPYIDSIIYFFKKINISLDDETFINWLQDINRLYDEFDIKSFDNIEIFNNIFMRALNLLLSGNIKFSYSSIDFIQNYINVFVSNSDDVIEYKKKLQTIADEQKEQENSFYNFKLINENDRQHVFLSNDNVSDKKIIEYLTIKYDNSSSLKLDIDEFLFIFNNIESPSNLFQIMNSEGTELPSYFYFNEFKSIDDFEQLLNFIPQADSHLSTLIFDAINGYYLDFSSDFIGEFLENPNSFIDNIKNSLIPSNVQEHIFNTLENNVLNFISSSVLKEASLEKLVYSDTHLYSNNSSKLYRNYDLNSKDIIVSNPSVVNGETVRLDKNFYILKNENFSINDKFKNILKETSFENLFENRLLVLSILEFAFNSDEIFDIFDSQINDTNTFNFYLNKTYSLNNSYNYDKINSSLFLDYLKDRKSIDDIIDNLIENLPEKSFADTFHQAQFYITLYNNNGDTIDNDFLEKYYNTLLKSLLNIIDDRYENDKVSYNLKISDIEISKFLKSFLSFYEDTQLELPSYVLKIEHPVLKTYINDLMIDTNIGINENEENILKENLINELKNTFLNFDSITDYDLVSIIRKLYDSEYFSISDIIDLIIDNNLITDKVDNILFFENNFASIFSEMHNLRGEDFDKLNDLPFKKRHYIQLKKQGLENKTFDNLNLYKSSLETKAQDLMKNHYGTNNYNNKDYYNNITQINERQTPFALKVWRSSNIYVSTNLYDNLVSTFSISDETLGEKSDYVNINRINKAVQDYLELKPKDVADTSYKIISNFKFVDNGGDSLFDILKFLESLLFVIKSEKEKGVQKIIFLANEIIPDYYKSLLEEHGISLLFDKKMQLIDLEDVYNEPVKKIQNAKEKLFEFSFADDLYLQVSPIEALILKIEEDISNIDEQISSEDKNIDYKQHNIYIIKKRSNNSLLEKEKQLEYFRHLVKEKFLEISKYNLDEMNIIPDEVKSLIKDIYFSAFSSISGYNYSSYEKSLYKLDEEDKEILLKIIKNFPDYFSEVGHLSKIFAASFDMDEVSDFNVDFSFISENSHDFNEIYNRSLSSNEFYKYFLDNFIKEEYRIIFNRINTINDYDVKNIIMHKISNFMSIQEEFISPKLISVKDNLSSNLIDFFIFMNENKTLYASSTDFGDFVAKNFDFEIFEQDLEDILLFIIKDNNFEDTSKSIMIEMVSKLFCRTIGIDETNFDIVLNKFIEINNNFFRENDFVNQSKTFNILIELKEYLDDDNSSNLLLSSHQINSLMYLDNHIKENIDKLKDSDNNDDNKVILSNDYSKSSYIDFIDFDFFDETPFIAFVHKSDEIDELYQELVTPDLMKIYGDKTNNEIDELNIEISLLIKQKKRYLELIEALKATKSIKKQNIINKELNDLNIDKINEAIRSVEDKFSKVWKSWYKDINVKLSLFNMSVFSEFSKNAFKSFHLYNKHENATIDLPSEINNDNFDFDLFQKLNDIYQKKPSEISYDDFLLLVGENPSITFIMSIFNGVDIKNKNLLVQFEFIIQNPSIENFEFLKNFDFKKYLKFKTKIFKLFGEKFHSDSSIEQEILEKILFLTDYDFNQVKVFKDFLDFYPEWTFDDFHYLNFDLINKIGGVKEYFKFARKIIPVLKNDEEIPDSEETNILKNILNNIDYVKDVLGTLSTNGTVLYSTAKIKSMNMNLNNPSMSRDLLHAVSSAGSNNSQLSISNTAEQRFNMIDDNLKTFNIKQTKTLNIDTNSIEDVDETIDNPNNYSFDNFFHFKRLYKNNEGHFVLQEDISPFDTRTYSQGYSMHSCLTPDGLAKSILTDMSSNPQKWDTLLISVEKSQIPDSIIELYNNKINLYNERLLEGYYDEKLDKEIKSFAQKYFFEVGASASWKKNLQRTYDNMETYSKTYVTDENGHTVRINESKDYIIEGIAVSSEQDILYSELKILEDILNHWNKYQNFNDFTIPKRQFYTTIGSGYSDIDLDTFKKRIPNKRLLEENLDVYTDARQSQQYLVSKHSKFSLENHMAIFDYFTKIMNDIVETKDTSNIKQKIKNIKDNILKNISYENLENKKQSKSIKKGI